MKEREFFKVILYDGFLVKHSGPGLGMDVVFSEHSGSGGQVWVSVMRQMAGREGG